mgnify:CR=1 FL=1
MSISVVRRLSVFPSPPSSHLYQLRTMPVSSFAATSSSPSVLWLPPSVAEAIRSALALFVASSPARCKQLGSLRHPEDDLETCLWRLPRIVGAAQLRGEGTSVSTNMMSWTRGGLGHAPTATHTHRYTTGVTFLGEFQVAFASCTTLFKVTTRCWCMAS